MRLGSLFILLALSGSTMLCGESILALQGQPGPLGDAWTGYYSDGNVMRAGMTAPLSGFGETNTAFLVSPLLDIDSHLIITLRYRTDVFYRRTPEPLAPVFADFWIALVGAGDLRDGMPIDQAWNSGLRIWEQDGVTDDWLRVYVRTSAVPDAFQGRVVFGFRGSGETAGWVPGADAEDASIVHNPEPSMWILMSAGIAVIAVAGLVRRRLPG